MTVPQTRLLAAALAAGVIALAGCGDDDGGGDGGGGSGESAGNGGSGGGVYGGGGSGRKEEKSGAGGDGAQTLKLSADPGGALAFDKSSLTAKAGKVKISMDNPSDVPHAVEVEGKGVEEEGETVGKGGVSKVTVDLEPGTYRYYCPVGNHADAGMEGELTVK